MGSVLCVVRYVLEYVRVREWVMYAQSRVGHWLRRGSNYLALRRRVGCRRQCHSCPDPSNLISLSSSITYRRIKSGRVQWATIGRSARIVIGPQLGSSRPQPIISLSPQEVLPPSASDGNCSPTRSFQTAGVGGSPASRDKNNPPDWPGSSFHFDDRVWCLFPRSFPVVMTSTSTQFALPCVCIAIKLSKKWAHLSPSRPPSIPLTIHASRQWNE